MLPKQQRMARSALAVKSRKAKTNPSPETLSALNDARRDYAAAALESYIERTVDAAPPLTTEQAGRLAALLRPRADAT